MLPEASRAYMPAMPVAVDINSQVLIVVRPLFLEGVGLKGHHQSIGLKTSYTSMMKMPLAADINR